MARFSNLIPLIILFILVGAAGFVGYQVYLWSNELADRASKKMEKKNLSFTKEGGLKVGVKDLRDESYADKTQNVLVNVWNNAAFPDYKSSLGWNSSADPKKHTSSTSTSRPSASRSSSNQTSARQGRPTASTSGSTLSPPAQGSQKRSASPVPGGWE